MKEITRIHIAKVVYDVELAAKKELESYLKSLEAYSNDTDIIEDIEIRITEILLERGVKKGGVISEPDVKALKELLGEPREFMADGDITIGPDEEAKVPGDAIRKLYRNTDSAVLGGVLSGIASFFKIDVVWVRLLFIILLIASGGTALLVYVVLWIAVPPAKTAADKLQMAGRAVTVGSIRALNENEANRPAAKGDDTTRRVLTTIAGIFSIIIATGAAMFLAVVLIAVFAGGPHYVLSGVENSGFFIAAFSLAVVSGLLFIVLCILAAYSAFAQKMTRRVLVSVCVVIILGLVSFGTAIGLTQYGMFERHQTVEANTRESTMKLPAGSETITGLVVDDAQHMNITYIATSEKSSATLKTMLRNGVEVPRPALKLENGTLYISSEKINDDTCTESWWCERTSQTLTVYGPALERITANEESSLSYVDGEQDSLAIVAEKDSSVQLSSSVIKTLKVTAKENARISVDEATIQMLDATMRTSAQLYAGTVRELRVVDTDSCPSQVIETSISVEGVTSGTMNINGVPQRAASVDSSCTKINIGKGENEEL